MNSKKNLVVFTGAGISEESGINTYSGENGLWKNYSINQCASLEAWKYKPQRVLDFYNERRKNILRAKPNKAHTNLLKLENLFHTTIITQNIDDLHERAGSMNIIHVHGEIMKARSVKGLNNAIDWKKDITLSNKCDKGFQLRPHVTMFGEKVMNFEDADKKIKEADILIVIGTSLNVYPAATLINSTKKDCIKYYIDTDNNSKVSGFHIIKDKATTGVTNLVNNLLFK